MRTKEPTQALADAALRIAARGAREYMHQRNLDANPDTLIACLRSWCKANMQAALYDAKQAIDAGMPHVAEQTFAHSMVLAGIEAAKECAMPIKDLAPA